MPAPDLTSQLQLVNAAFSKQAAHYDDDDSTNAILLQLRSQVYSFADSFLKPQSSILELNAGTGIDALRFAKAGYVVHATDLSDGMIDQIKKKIDDNHLADRFTVQQLSYDQLEELKGRRFDFVFSNFGGLNCCDDLSRVTKDLPDIIRPGAHVVWVLMPRVSPWELLGVVKGNKSAFRRLKKNGTTAEIDGEYFQTWYHSLAAVRRAFGQRFKFIRSTGLAALSPPPHAHQFAARHKTASKILEVMDAVARNHFPFNRWADHIGVCFRFIG